MPDKEFDEYEEDISEAAHDGTFGYQMTGAVR